MDCLDIGSLKACAGEKLKAQVYPARRLALIYAGAVALVMLAVTGINYYVNQQMDAITGLSGLGMVSVLETVQRVLSYGVNICMPFWRLGFVFAMLGVARDRQMQPGALLEGFRRFGPVLRLMLLRGLVYGIIGMVGAYIGVLIYLVTPLARPLLALTIPLAEAAATPEQMLEGAMQLPMEQLTAAIMPAYAIIIPLCGLLLAPVFYRFRLAELVVMDQPGTGALAALFASSALSRHRRMQLFLLDLRFWWYYGLQLLGTLLCWVDVLLPAAGAVVSIGGYVLGLALQTGVHWYAGGYIHTTWAVAYDALRRSPVQEKKPAPDPEKLPWEPYDP